MTDVTHQGDLTGLVAIDPYNDFISEGGKVWGRLKGVAEAGWSRETFEYGTWGGEIHPEFEPQPGDIVAQEHWCSSGFANTDLDLLLKEHGIHQLIVVGLIAHTCVEATVRYGAELSYQVTVVKDATASYSDKEMDAALAVNMPNYASAILTASEVLAALTTHCAKPRPGR